tara:strand:+ start:193 stop:420 length:228 start_codon:yes stop_codon:yes gene_type:complete
MMIEEINMKIGDLVVATDVSFEGDRALSVGSVGLVKRVEHGNTYFNPQVLVFWMRYGYQTWEHPDAVELVSSVKK